VGSRVTVQVALGEPVTVGVGAGIVEVAHAPSRTGEHNRTNS
jgi:hypothetical protein